MALVVSDRVRETTASTGTGAITLDGAQANFVAFSAALSDGDTTFYAIVDNNNLAWETGVGTYASAGNTIARTTVLGSSNAGSLVNLQAGLKDVFLTNPATQAVYLDANDKIAGNQTFSGTVTLNADPASGLQAATKQYVDTIAAAGLHYHDPVRVEKEGNLVATYDNGTAGVGATLTNADTQAALVIDDVTLSVSDRVLIYEQTDATQNGVYTVTDTGSVSTNWVLTRATDADTYAPSDPDSFGQGDAFFVREGTLGAGETYVMNTEGTITFGTTDITFAQVSSAQVYIGGTGIDITGNTISSDATLAEVTSNGASTTDALSLAGITVTSFAMGSAYSLPTSDGTSGQFLQTNGSGTVTFATASVPTLDAVTGAGNNTANNITVGNINASDVSCNAFTSTGIDDNATSTAITIDSSENVLIATTESPATIATTSTEEGLAYQANDYLAISRSANQPLILNRLTDDGPIISLREDGTQTAAISTIAGSGLAFGTGTLATEAMRLDAAGDLGINITNPTEKLHVGGNILATGTVTATTFSGNATTATTATNCSRSVSAGTGLTGGGALTANRTLSLTADQRLASGNNVQTGATTSYCSYQSSSGTKYARWYLENDEDMRLTEGGSLICNGNVTAYSTTITSDARLKKDVETIDNALDLTCSLRGVSFTWNEKSNREGVNDYGLIAQEVQEHLPELVVEADTLGSEDETHLTVDYPKLVGVLIEAIKELKAEIDEFKGAK